MEWKKQLYEEGEHQDDTGPCREGAKVLTSRGASLGSDKCCQYEIYRIPSWCTWEMVQWQLQAPIQPWALEEPAGKGGLVLLKSLTNISRYCTHIFKPHADYCMILV